MSPEFTVRSQGKMRLRAEVKSILKRTNFAGYIENSEVKKGAVLPDPKWVEIEETDGSYYLNRYGADGKIITDTWHQSIGEAKAQATYEYGIPESDWQAAGE